MSDGVHLRDIYRIVDAAANRAAEGLRTAEEFARFVLNSATLTESAKQIRHALAAALAPLERAERLAARDTPGDVGTAVTAPGEFYRGSPLEVAVAAMERVQQSLRCLEEYGKLISVAMAGEIEALRYRTYSLAQQIELAAGRQRRLEGARLYVLVDLRGDMETWRNRVQELVDAGADVIQIRDKQCEDRALYERARVAAEMICRGEPVGRCQLIINDRADIAAAVDADGVHVGQEELPVHAARRVVGPHKLVGLSTHSLDQAQAADAEQADYIGCGPTFPSRTKTFPQFAGLELLAQIAAEITVPAFAIGGIDATNVASVCQAGIRRVAVGEAIWGSADIAAACRTIKDQLG